MYYTFTQQINSGGNRYEKDSCIASRGCPRSGHGRVCRFSAAPTQTTSDTASDASDTPASNAETPAASSGAKLRFVTGGESGTYYAFGSVIAQHATNNAGVDVVGLVGNGSQSNIFELEDGNAELAFCESDVMAYAYDGTNLFADTGAVSCFSTVAALYTKQVQIVTTDPEIKSVDDLKGKNVSIGAAGSGVSNAMDVLGAYGLTEQDINPTYQSFGDSGFPEKRPDRRGPHRCGCSDNGSH